MKRFIGWVIAWLMVLGLIWLAHYAEERRHQQAVGYTLSQVDAVNRMVAKSVPKPMTRENALKMIALYGRE